MTQLQQLIQQPLSDTDLRHILGKDLTVLTYSHLQRFSHIEELLDKDGQAMILWVTSEHNGSSQGHWIALYTAGNPEDKILSFMNSFGLPPDDPWTFNWISSSERAKLHQTRKELTRLLADAQSRGWTIVYNNYRFQSLDPAVATCGKWAAWRLLEPNLSAAVFKNRAFKLARKYGSLDGAVAAVIQSYLN